MPMKRRTTAIGRASGRVTKKNAVRSGSTSTPLAFSKRSFMEMRSAMSGSFFTSAMTFSFRNERWTRMLSASQFDDLAAGQALADQARQRVNRVQGGDQDALALGSAVVREPRRRDRLPDAALSARKDVPHLRSLLEEFVEGCHVGSP